MCTVYNPALVTKYNVDTSVMPNVVANMTPYVDNTVNAKYELLPGSVAVRSSSTMKPLSMNEFVCADVYTYVDKIPVDQKLRTRASEDRIPWLSKQMEDKEEDEMEDKERMKKLHKPQTTTLLPPRRVL